MTLTATQDYANAKFFISMGKLDDTAPQKAKITISDVKIVEVETN